MKKEFSGWPDDIQEAWGRVRALSQEYHASLKELHDLQCKHFGLFVGDKILLKWNGGWVDVRVKGIHFQAADKHPKVIAVRLKKSGSPYIGEVYAFDTQHWKRKPEDEQKLAEDRAWAHFDRTGTSPRDNGG